MSSKVNRAIHFSTDDEITGDSETISAKIRRIKDTKGIVE